MTVNSSDGDYSPKFSLSSDDFNTSSLEEVISETSLSSELGFESNELNTSLTSSQGCGKYVEESSLSDDTSYEFPPPSSSDESETGLSEEKAQLKPLVVTPIGKNF